MTISFTFIPGDLRVPGTYVEFDSSRALGGLTSAPNRILVIGQKLISGTIAALTPTLIAKADDARVLFGRGSFGALAFDALKAVNDRTETWGIALADLGAGTAATGALTFTGPVAVGGQLTLYVNGTRITLGLAATTSATAVAAAVAAAINERADLPLTATSNAAVVTLTCRHKGTAGNDIDLSHSYYQGEALPAGLGLTVTAMNGGAGNPSLDAVWAALGDSVYNVIILPFADAASLASAETEMERRSGPAVATDGIAVAGVRGTFAALSALGASRNAKFASLVGAKGSPSHPVAWAAGYYGVVAAAAAIDPARPFQTLKVAGLLAPRQADRFIQSERELLLRDGISTFTVDSGGSVIIERPISTYQMNAQGFDDLAWLDLNVPFILARLRFTFRARRASMFPRHKLADDGSSFGAGQAIVTPSALRADNVAWYADTIEAGLCEDMAGFKADMIVERDPTDRSRTNEVLPCRLVGQFRVQAAKIEYRL
jgi:phage tail sheath gpL-like